MKPIQSKKTQTQLLSSMHFNCSDPLEGYLCTKCSKSFQLKIELLEHISLGHKSAQAEDQIILKCPKCEFTTFCHIILAKHDVDCVIPFRPWTPDSLLTAPLQSDEDVLYDQPVYDIICSFLQKPFSERSEDEKNEIVSYGRPTPVIFQTRTEQSDTESVCEDKENIEDLIDTEGEEEEEADFMTADEETENTEILSDRESDDFSEKNEDEDTTEKELPTIYYIDYPWLCGSYYLQKVFCWPCLLFSKTDDPLVSYGIKDFFCLRYYTVEHAKDEEHTKNVTKHAWFKDKLGIGEGSQKFSVSSFNENVLCNRFLTEMFIRAGMFVLKSGKDNTTDMFQHLIEFMLALGEESVVRTHYERIRDSFPGDLESLYKDIVFCITDYLQNHVRNEIKTVPFYSVRMDDAFLVTGESQCSLIIRFVNADGDLVERFLGFFNVDEEITTWFEVIDQTLGEFDYKRKLVGQAYDGGKPAIVTDLLQRKIKEEAPEALFVYCVEHEFNLFLQQIMKNFLLDFIWNCNQINKILPNILRIIPDWPVKPLNLYKTVKDGWNCLKEALNQIENDDYWYGEASFHALSLLRDMGTTYFAFFTCVCSEIFEKSTPLNEYLQGAINIEELSKKIQDFLNEIDKMRDVKLFERFFQEAKAKCEYEEDKYSYYKKKYLETIDNIFLEVKVRFQEMVNLKFLDLANSSKFKDYSKHFPTALCENLQQSYPNIFQDVQSLINELEMFYQIEIYHDKNIEDIIKILSKDDFHKLIFGEVNKLFRLILTLPLMKVGKNMYLKSIKTCSKHTTEDHLDEYLDAQQIQCQFLDQVTKLKRCYNDIIDKFVAVNTRPVDLVFIK